MKVEAFLKIAEIPYQIIIEDNPSNAPKGKLPFIRDNGITISDSELIFDYLESKLDFKVDGHLSEHDKVLHHATIRMLDEHLYWALLYSRWIDAHNFNVMKAEIFSDTPPPLNGIKANKRRKQVQVQLEAHGLGKHSSEEIYQKAKKDLVVLSKILGDHQWFGGDFISKLDLAATAYLSQIMIEKLNSPLAEMLKQLGNLETYVVRSKRILFPGDHKKEFKIPGARINLEE